MNVEKYLVFIKGEDKTEQIAKYNIHGNMIDIIYKDSDKKYTYAKNHFIFYKDPKEIDVSEYISTNVGYIYNVKKLLKFGRYYKAFFKDNTTAIIEDYKLEENMKKQSTDIMGYFREIAKRVSIKTEEGNTLLSNEYKKIKFISKDTALYNYLNPTNLFNKHNVDNNIIFPFGANESQFNAVRNAMNSKISVIQGPPGTGKTQTILNIIANIVRKGQTVAVVSNNNAATDNVYEKLKNHNFDFLCATLGKKENKEKFIKSQTGEYPELKGEIINKWKYEEEIKTLNKEIMLIFKLQNNIAQLKDELSQIKTEHSYFDKQEKINNMPQLKSIRRGNSNTILKLKIECEELEANKQNINKWFKIKACFIYGIGNFKFYNRPIKEIINYYNKIYFIVREIEIGQEIKECTHKLNLLGNENKTKDLVRSSITLFNDYLITTYNQIEQRRIFTMQDLYTNSSTFNKEYPIILSTTHSIKNCLNSEYKFDYIIIDEASQVDLVTGVLALSSAKNAVIVGDLKQLPNVITTEDRTHIEDINDKYKVDNIYNYLQNSFLSSITKTVSEEQKTLLKEHYRCHPKIIGFCNKKFYNNNLIIMTEDKGEDDVLQVYITNEGNHARGHFNQRQIDVIKEEVIPELEKKIDKKNIGIISPYRKQTDEMKKNIEEDLQIDTVHKYQGREKDAIIITTVDNEITEFVDDPKMLNVAVTRAKRYLRLVVSNNKANEGTNIDDLIKYIRYNNFDIVESKVKSIYDLLYKAQREKRKQYLQGKKRISEFNSENITYHLIEEIIEQNNYDNLDIAVHVPLKEILKDFQQLNDDELKFASNVWTHLDFVIYNKMDKKTILGIEVDGYYYHREGTKQQEKDRLKERILEKYEIPLIRLNTTGSGEKEVLNEKMKEIFKMRDVTMI